MCPKNYSREDNAVQHYNQEHGILRKKCPVCFKEIKPKSFSKHIKTHTKPKTVRVKCKLHFDRNGISSSIATVRGIDYALFPLSSQT